MGASQSSVTDVSEPDVVETPEVDPDYDSDYDADYQVPELEMDWFWPFM